MDALIKEFYQERARLEGEQKETDAQANFVTHNSKKRARIEGPQKINNSSNRSRRNINRGSNKKGLKSSMECSNCKLKSHVRDDYWLLNPSKAPEGWSKKQQAKNNSDNKDADSSTA
jgi:hypothetical protein